MSMFDPPKVPDAASAAAAGQQTAAAQQTANVAGQRGSMVDQNNPYGSLTYNQTGVGPNGVPIYTANTTLTPQQQDLFNTLYGTKATAGKQGQDLISGANYGSMSPAEAIGGMTSGITSDILGKETGFLSPFFGTERDQLDTKLKNQGLSPGNPAYDNAMRSMDTSHGLTVSNFLANAEPQAFSQASSLYKMPAELGGSLAQFGAPGSPNADFVNAPGLQPANVIGATANAQDFAMKAYDAQSKQYGNMMSGLFGIPTALLGGWAKGGFKGLGSTPSTWGVDPQGFPMLGTE